MKLRDKGVLSDALGLDLRLRVPLRRQWRAVSGALTLPWVLDDLNAATRLAFSILISPGSCQV